MELFQLEYHPIGGLPFQNICSIIMLEKAYIFVCEVQYGSNYDGDG